MTFNHPETLFMPTHQSGGAAARPCIQLKSPENNPSLRQFSVGISDSLQNKIGGLK
jgi:hypothetical protein